jgi:hypothetical protein
LDNKFPDQDDVYSEVTSGRGYGKELKITTIREVMDKNLEQSELKGHEA